ncbi:MAG TPA: ABC transporter permease [Vicinamibacterales bacterium]
MRFYDWLLHCYPTSFRNEYGPEMRSLFARRRLEAQGPLRGAALWISTVAEVAGNAALVHLDILRQDIAYSWRMVRRAPGFAVTAVVIVALGIGATTAAFSVTDFVLLRPLPFAEADRLVELDERTPGYSRLELSAANYRDWKQAATVFESIGLYHSAAGNLIGAGDPMRVEGAAVSADLFPTLRVQPLAGRLFTVDEDRSGAPGTLLLSYRLWQTRFGGDRSIVGQQVLLDAESYTIIGIMPQDFRFPTSEALYWTPLRFNEEMYVDRNDNWHYAVGRLKPGVSIERARAEMDVIAAASRAQYPAENKDIGANLIGLGDQVPRQSRLLLYALSGAAACVLLIACANLANLLLARALQRRRELAVRTAMGAGRERMVRQLMTESLMLAVVGGAVGVAIAYVAVPLLNRLVPASLPLASSPTVDLRVLLFATALTVVTGLLFGLAPVMRIGGEADLGGLREGSRSGGGRKEGVRSTLVVIEIVASVVLLVSAGLLMRALWTVQAVDPGFRSEGVLTLQTPLPIPQYNKTSTREGFYTRVISGLKATPGITNAAFVSFLPLGAMRGGIWPVSLDGRPVNRAEGKNAFLRYVTPGYFGTLGVPIKTGRDVADSDTHDSQYVAVVSESFIKRYWPGETPASAIGRHFNFALKDRIVAGVSGDVRMRGLERDAEPQVYLPYRQVDDGFIIGYIPRGLVIRTSTPPATLAPAVRAIIQSIDPAMPVTDVNTLGDVVERDTASRSAQLRVLAAFALIALVLAGIGIHGLLSFSVSQRSQEIGVRRALGAQSADILSMVIGQCLKLAGVGVVLGVALAYAAGRSMQALLAGVKPADAATLTGAVVLAIAMTAIGSLVPTLRALRVDPNIALRAE